MTAQDSSFTELTKESTIYMETKLCQAISKYTGPLDEVSTYSSGQNKSHISFLCDGHCTKIWLPVWLRSLH